jgi:malate dehydrogenase (oxaloacetate-decarboxylating)(NADP+)
MIGNKGRKGYSLLYSAPLNKSTGFSREERDEYGLRGLLPYQVCNLDLQTDRVLANMRRKESNIEKYIYLGALHERNERLFYRTVIDNIEEVMPLIYTPTVGQACSEFAHIFRRPKGFYVNPDDKGYVRKMLDNWPRNDVRVVVITDGQRILGLGDLGSNGMGIPIGKLQLYVACAGINPMHCLPIMLDVGTNNEELLNDPLYLGYPSKRIEGDEYRDLIEETIAAVQDKYPKAMIQFEDFLTPNAYSLLEEYKDRVLCFNDDIQGTASVSLAGVYASTRLSGKDFKDLKIMFLGAGSAATGIGDLMVSAFEAEGLSNKEARERLWFVDKDGLLVKSRSTELMPHNLPYAHDMDQMSFIDAIDTIRPNILIGATGAPGTFTEEVVRAMTRINNRPAIFALSNPTSRAECTAEQAYDWSNGLAIFSSGSPFDPVKFEGKTYRPGQGNNAYIFPGVGLGAIVAEADKITDHMFMTAAKTLADMVSEDDLEHGALYPPLHTIRDVSLEIAVAVAEEAFETGNANEERPDDLRGTIVAQMYDPHY